LSLAVPYSRGEAAFVLVLLCIPEIHFVNILTASCCVEWLPKSSFKCHQNSKRIELIFWAVSGEDRSHQRYWKERLASPQQDNADMQAARV